MKEGRSMKKIATVVALVFLLSILSGCVNNTQRGTGIGAAGEALIGAAEVCTATKTSATY